MDEISKGLFADRRKIGRRGEQKVRLAKIRKATTATRTHDSRRLTYDSSMGNFAEAPDDNE